MKPDKSTFTNSMLAMLGSILNVTMIIEKKPFLDPKTNRYKVKQQYKVTKWNEVKDYKTGKPRYIPHTEKFTNRLKANLYLLELYKTYSNTTT